MNDPKGFLKFPRQEIPRRTPGTRIKDWQEIEQTPNENFLKIQGARCMDCGVPFCQSETGCPVDNDIPEWNSLVSQGKWQEAAIRLLATNNFPEFTGRLCPAPCESACVLGINANSVNIRSLEWGIIEKAFQEGWIRPEPAKNKSGKSIAIIGSGPAGLAAAQQLIRAGHSVTVFERESRIGGLLRYGIPDFKMQKFLIDRRLQQMDEEGVLFKTSTEFGRDIFYKDLEKDFDAIALTTGAERPRDLKVSGRELGGIHFAMDFLRDQSRILSGEKETNAINAKGKRVIILGGGDTGSDCLGTALRQGCKQILQFEIQPKPSTNRSEETPWPYWPMKLKTSHAHEEGGIRHWSLSTQEFLGENGQVRQLIANKTSVLGETQEQISFDTDLVILALGFTGIKQENLNSIPNLKFTARGEIETQEFATSVPGVFAAGDARRGASLIVWAIAEGRKMAKAIDGFLTTSITRNDSYPTQQPSVELADGE
jgi:glutamate synthase (NADPH/NADH) small chain